jgi:hypothetical protein
MERADHRQEDRMNLFQRLAARRDRIASNRPWRVLQRAREAEMKAIGQRLWAEANLRDATHGRDERTCILLTLASRYEFGYGDDSQAKLWQVPDEWMKDAAARRP